MAPSASALRSAPGTSLGDIRPDGSTLRVGLGARRDQPAADPPRLVELSPREQQIVRLVAKGLVNKTIGSVLDISPWTVATHLRRIFAKLGVASRASMVAAIYESERSPARPSGESAPWHSP